jgi:2-C-methyl-D-erythritol 4-phosphate cytidylyltransferase
VICAIIVAGGSGSRLPGALRKQYRPLAGQAVLARTLAIFEASPEVDHLLLVVPGEDLDYCRENFLATAGKPVELVAGGRERQESVYHGLCRCPRGAEDLVVIHDAVRPLLAARHLAACVAGPRRWGASILAVPAVDTLKQVGPEGRIEATRDRRNLWLAQTPQAFRTRLIFEAHERARREGIVATDDAQLVERLGAPVHVVAGSRTNLKITTAEDLLLAEALLQSGGL